MKKTTIAATGTALVAGAYIVVASLFPSMIERRANSPESMKQVRAEVKQPVNEGFYSGMKGPMPHKVNGLPFETPKQVYSDVEKRNIQRLGLYIDDASKRGDFRILVNGHGRPSVFNPSARFEPTNYSARIEYKCEPIASFLIGQNPDGKYAAKHVYPRDGTMFERELRGVAKSATVDSAIIGTEKGIKGAYNRAKKFFQGK